MEGHMELTLKENHKFKVHVTTCCSNTFKEEGTKPEVEVLFFSPLNSVVDILPFLSPKFMTRQDSSYNSD